MWDGAARQPACVERCGRLLDLLGPRIPCPAPPCLASAGRRWAQHWLPVWPTQRKRCTIGRCCTTGKPESTACSAVHPGAGCTPAVLCCWATASPGAPAVARPLLAYHPRRAAHTPYPPQAAAAGRGCRAICCGCGPPCSHFLCRRAVGRDAGTHGGQPGTAGRAGMLPGRMRCHVACLRPMRRASGRRVLCGPCPLRA